MAKQTQINKDHVNGNELSDQYFYEQLQSVHYADSASRLATDPKDAKRVYSSGMLNDKDLYDSKLGDFSSTASGYTYAASSDESVAHVGYENDSFDQSIDERYPYQAYDASKAQLELAKFYKSMDITQDRIKAELLIKEKALELKKQAEEASLSNKLLPYGHKQTLAISVQSSNEQKEQARIALASMIYKPQEICSDPCYFEAVEIKKEPPFMFSHIRENKIYEWARHCPKIEAIAPACISYLQEHFPLGNRFDQEQFNLIVLALFEKMRDGDICIDLRTLNGLFDAIVKWDLMLWEATKFNEPMSVQDSLEYLVASATSFCPRSVETVEAILSKSIAVGSAKEVNSPLVYDNGRLYLRRSFNYEIGIADYIARNQSVGISDENKAKLIRAMHILFPKEAGNDNVHDEVNMQEVAAALSAQSKLTVISGGPGTGKTTTVLRILLLLICMDEKNRNIQLCAPTGKAAARMSESIAAQLNNANTQKVVEAMAKEFGYSVDTIVGYIPSTASTVHGLIGSIPHSAYARFNHDNRLKCDVLVVDEVSMLDMAMFSKLLSALEDDCKIIMLGDKDQLASVEAGAVLAELCDCLDSQDPHRVDEKVMSVITEATQYSAKSILKEKISGYVALLSKSWRSKDVPEIGTLASIINNANKTELENNQEIIKGSITAYIKENRLKISNADEDNMAQAVRNRMGKIMYEFVKVKNQAERKGVEPAIAFNEYTFDCPPHDYIRQIAQESVQRGQLNNYSAFLEELEHNDFIVSADPVKRAKLFNLMDRFRILCSNHNGEFGDKSLNLAIEAEVKRNYLQGKAHYEQGAFFPGQIVIVTQNNKALHLVNGYVGFVAFDEQDLIKQVLETGRVSSPATANTHALVDSERAQVAVDSKPAQASQEHAKVQAIPAAHAHGLPHLDNNQSQSGLHEMTRAIPYWERKLRVFLPIASEAKAGIEASPFTVISTMLLTDYDSGYAMSIHKSQGSEYDKVSIILSKTPNRVLTKELVYTGITRAKKQVELVSSRASLRFAISHSVERESGLSDRLAAIREDSSSQI